VTGDALARAEGLCEVLRGYRFSYNSEARLQQAIEAVLREHGYAFVREKRLSRRDRPDFDVEGVAVEVKVKHSLTVVLRQLFRYAQQPAVQALVLVTTCSSHTQVPDVICGKPVRIVHIVGALA
jgi:hypothetical protein